MTADDRDELAARVEYLEAELRELKRDRRTDGDRPAADATERATTDRRGVLTTLGGITAGLGLGGSANASGADATGAEKPPPRTEEPTGDETTPRWSKQGCRDAGLVRVAGTGPAAESQVSATYDVADYEDVGALVQRAVDDLVAAGMHSGVVNIPPGEYEYATTPVIDVHLLIRGSGPTTSNPNGKAGTHPTATMLRYSGSGNGFVVRGTERSPMQNALRGVQFEKIGLVPATRGDGTNGVYLDGTRTVNPDQWVMSDVTFRDCYISQWGNDCVKAAGGVFQVSAHNSAFTEGRNYSFEATTSSNDPPGQPVAYYFYNTVLWANASSTACARIRSNTLGYFGGVVAGSGADGLVVDAATGVVHATNVEGTETEGTTGLVLEGAKNGFSVHCNLARWDTGLDIGNGTSEPVGDVEVNGNFYRNATDVRVSEGGPRRNVVLKADGLSVADDRRRNTGRSQVHGVPRCTYCETVSVDVGSTGRKRVGVDGVPLSGIDALHATVSDASDADFSLTTPVFTRSADGRVTGSTEVLTASANRAATAELTVTGFTFPYASDEDTP